MRRKISAILVTVLIMLTVMPMGAFAAVPSVQEVETLIAQIGTVTRENRSAVEKAVNAYNQLDDASKAGVSNFDVLAEAQQILGIKDALAKLNVEHDRVENNYTISDSYVESTLNTGLCMIAPSIRVYGDRDELVLMISFVYVGDELLNANRVIVRAGDDKYTYNQDAFSAIGRDVCKINTGKLKWVEGFVTRAEDFDIELLRDALSSQEAIFRFSGYQNYDYVLTQQNRQAITDVLNAYNLMCSVSPDVLRKALA